jgi:hypothetical protein
MHDEDSIIIKLIMKNFTCEAKGFWIINDSTIGRNPSFYCDKKFLKVVDSGTLFDLCTRISIENKNRHRINYSSDYLNDTTVLHFDTTFVKCVFDTSYNGFSYIRKVYPKFFGIAEWSKVAYVNNYAMVYVGFIASLLGGEGRVYVLTKVTGEWRIVISKQPG